MADEPRFHRQPPGGLHLVVSSVRHVSDCPPERLVKQAENLSSLPFGQAQPAALVVEEVAGGAALQQSFGSVIEVV